MCHEIKPTNQQTKPIVDTNNLLLYGINHFYLILVIFKQKYFTHKRDANRYYRFVSEGTRD